MLVKILRWYVTTSTQASPPPHHPNVYWHALMLPDVTFAAHMYKKQSNGVHNTIQSIELYS